jgi:hypothetical protein
MTRSQLTRTSRLIALVGSLALLVALSFDWHSADVHVVGVVDAEGSSVGWSGWGLLSGVFAMLVAVIAFADLRADDAALVRRFAVAVLPPVGMLAATALAVFAGDADVNVVGVTSVEADSILWPAWVGFVLAAISSVAALVPVVAQLAAPTAHGLPGPT